MLKQNTKYFRRKSTFLQNPYKEMIESFTPELKNEFCT